LQVVQSGFGGGDYVYQALSPAQKESARTAMQLFGIAHLAGRYVQAVSTGELRRILVARALAAAPRVLICDEICDGLDAGSRATLLQALDHVARNRTQLLYTTHREEELVPALTHRLRLEQGRIAAQGRVLRRRQPARRATPVTESLRTEDPQSDRGASQRDHRIVKSPPRAKALIRIEGADVYLGLSPVLREIWWELRAGEHWAILGPNGAGKSTFLKLICGDVHPAFGGRVRRFEFTARNTLWEVKRRIGFVSPELQANYRGRLRGAEVIASGFHSSIGLGQTLSARQRERVDALVDGLGLCALAKKAIGEMSYGEFRQLLLARALVHAPDILVFDEPFDGLDAQSKAGMTRVLENVADKGTSLIVVSHHAADLPGRMTHVARLEHGRITAQGPISATDS
jgi:molybdate transport system ATP-binding protein